MNWKDELNKIKNELPKENDLRFIDTHAHYNSPQFKKNQKEVLENLRDELQYIINLGTNMKSNTETLQLISLYDYIYGMIGFFPTDTWQLEEEFCPKDVNNFVFNAKDNLLVFEKQLLNQKIVGIGEIGLDYHWEDYPSKEVQIEWFIKQIKLANKYNLPIIIHSRDAMGDTVEVLKQNKEYYKKGIMHCYQGSIETSKELEKLGFYFSFAGPLTYKNSDKLKEVAKNIPIDKILVETDDPYLPPVPFRGKQNHPKYVTYVVTELANLRNLSYEETCEITYNNALKVFDL